MERLDSRIDRRLTQPSAALAGRDWLVGEFTLADLMMAGVLRRIEGSDLLNGHPDLAAYLVRATDRPAWHRAFAAQARLAQKGGEGLLPSAETG